MRKRDLQYGATLPEVLGGIMILIILAGMFFILASVFLDQPAKKQSVPTKSMKFVFESQGIKQVCYFGLKDGQQIPCSVEFDGVPPGKFVTFSGGADQPRIDTYLVRLKFDAGAKPEIRTRLDIPGKKPILHYWPISTDKDGRATVGIRVLKDKIQVDPLKEPEPSGYGKDSTA